MRRPGCVRPGTRVWPLVAFLLAGCTMCPDPYDYSGPVPNGSAPQNDFRARSNGIIPIGAAPRPWPPIVRTEPAAEATRIPEVVAEESRDVAAAFEKGVGSHFPAAAGGTALPGDAGQGASQK